MILLRGGEGSTKGGNQRKKMFDGVCFHRGEVGGGFSRGKFRKLADVYCSGKESSPFSGGKKERGLLPAVGGDFVPTGGGELSWLAKEPVEKKKSSA